MLPLAVRRLGTGVLSIIRRNLVATTSINIRSSNDFDDDHFDQNHHKIIQPDVLFSSENRERLLQRLQVAPPIGVRRSSNERERALAAVLICLCVDEKGDVSILYTRRSMQISRHVRQISFPGGIKDHNDKDFIECALRETEEEIGLSRKLIDVWGTGKLITPPNTASIMPVVGSMQNFDIRDLHLNEAEVEEAFLIPIKDLTHRSNIRYTQFKGGFSSPTFVVGRHRVWGITGFITNSFLNCLIPMELKRLKHSFKYVKPFKHKK